MPVDLNFRIKLKQNHSMRREFRNSLEQFRAWRFDKIDLFHFFVMAKQFSVLGCQPVAIAKCARRLTNYCYCLCIWMEAKRQVNGFRNSHRGYNPCSTWRRLFGKQEGV